MADPATAALVIKGVIAAIELGLKVANNRGRVNPDEQLRYIETQNELRKLLVAEANDLVTIDAPDDSNEGGDPLSTDESPSLT